MFRPTVSANIRRYYKNMKGETGKTKEQPSPLTILFKPELIIFISRNNKIFLLLFTVFTHLSCSGGLLLTTHPLLVPLS